MRARKVTQFDPARRTLLSGEKEHLIELRGDKSRLRAWLRCDKVMLVGFIDMDGQLHPFEVGSVVKIDARLRNVAAMHIEVPNKGTVSVEFEHQVYGVDHVDYKPVVLVPPMNADIPIRNLVKDLVERELAARGMKPGDTIEDDVSLEFDDGEEDFGEGYAEPDEPPPPRGLKWKEKKHGKDDGPAPSVAGPDGDGDGNDPGGKRGSEPGVQPKAE